MSQKLKVAVPATDEELAAARKSWLNRHDQIVFWDQAGFHSHPEASNSPAQVCLVELPAYSSEFNSIENLWNSVKR